MKKVWFNKSLSALRALVDLIRAEDKDQKFNMILSHPQETSTISMTDAEFYQEPNLAGAAYVDWCIGFCREHKIDLFVPAKEVIEIAKRKDEFLPTKVLLVSDVDTLSVLENKAKFTEVLEGASIPTAQTKAVRSLEEFREAHATLKPAHEKLCIKPSISIFGLGFRVLDEQNTLITHILKGKENIVNRHELEKSMEGMPAFDPPLLLMEYLPGPEWSVDCVARNGILYFAVQRCKPNQAGAAQVITQDQEIQAMSERLTALFHLSGMFNIQFRQSKDGIKVLEINARPSGGSPSACLAGPNLPLENLKLAMNEAYQPKPVPVKVGMRIQQITVPQQQKEKIQ